MAERGCLTILPSFSAARRADGGIVLTGKFVSGVSAYQKYWTEMGGGKVRVVMEEGAADGVGNLVEVVVKPGAVPWEIELAAYEKETLRPWLEPSGVVLLGVHYRQTPVGGWCGEWGVPAVYTAENTLRTKLEMLGVERVNPLVRLRRKMWLRGEEKRVRAAIAAAAGVQCNGTPAYEAYRGIAKDALLYFDTRVGEGMLASEEGVERRMARLRATGILRLAFSGRLVAIKGVDHLVEVAGELVRRGVKFELAICGAGAMKGQMKEAVAARGLGGVVRFKGSLDFERELVPFVRENVDVFVCCHRQGDPSCTYLETMSCGVPIAGYGNEAFEGVAKASGAGWVTAMDRPVELAGRIAGLKAEEIQEHGLKALKFAREHTFERTFRRRAEQLWRLANRGVTATQATTTDGP